MSDVQSRPARGRSSARGGRGGHASRGPRSNKQTNGDGAIDTSADQGQLGELKKRYSSQLTTLKELFPDWADVDLVLALEESDGDLASTIEKITEGHVSQFAEVKKANDRSRSKVKDAAAANESGSTIRGGSGRARGGDSIRGRGRGTDRGRGGFRGRGGAASNGTRTGGAAVATSVPTTESNAWDVPAATEAKEDAQPKATEAPAAKIHASKAPAPATPAAKTWASMFATVPKPAVPKPVAKPAPPPEEPASAPAEVSGVAQEPTVEAAEMPPPPVADEVIDEPPITADNTSKLTPDNEEAGPELTLTPSKDELTKDNIEHLPDDTHGPPTETVASTVASSKDIGSLASVATPLSAGGQAPIGRPGIGGYQTTALKATAGAHRSTSFQRRLLEQQEAVVMPGNHAVNQAAVQFGSLGLNGDPAEDLDVDEDREDAETRTQPPQHSPVAQPRAALPPAPRQAPAADSQTQESIPTPKQAPGLPPVTQQPLSQQSPSNPLASQAMQNQGSQNQQPYNQFGRYGQAETAAPPQKPYDPFGQQAPQSSQYDYSGQQQAQQQPSQTQIGGFSSAPEAFGSQYPTSDQQRSAAYQQYYGSYAQQGTPSQQEAGVAQQRTGSAFGAGPTDSAFSQTQSQQQSQSRYNEAQNSGHNTPNPALGGQHPSGPASQQQGQHMQQPHGQPGHAGNYPYSHPYYASNPYYANYASQYGGYGQGGYANFGKSMYGQSHHYGGMPPQGSFDQHSSSPANVGAFGGSSVHGRDSGLGGGLGDYGRSVSGAGQNQHNATAGSGAFGGIPDSYRQPQGGYGGQSSYGQQQIGQQGPNEDSLKPFGDSKSGGPSPSALGAQPGRPGSATNNPQSQGSQSGLPQQQGFGGYPGHLNQLQGGQGNQYGGLGGLGHQGAGSHQNNFGQYGGFGGGYGSYNRGGWGTNYQQH
ncbi:RNAPII degradation factor [Paraconiothyrium brasiliense]|uniref:RNA polymerase II degradation factor 1 n=1 Tax=Paraconiothyrium brasiliense TaxID=300254 RepID=A0ABR3S0P3_9PLEO